MHRLVRSARYAARGLMRTPIFTLTAVATLALAIGANSAVFSIIDRVFFRPLPFSDPDRLVYVTHINERSSLRIGIPPARLLDWSERNTSFEAIAGYFIGNVTDTTGDRPELVLRATVSRGFLDVWGIEPALGRDFSALEHSIGGPASVLISDRYWRQRLSASPNAVGETLIIEGQPVTVVGVMPPEFERVDADVDLWGPVLDDAPFAQPRDIGWFGGVVGRLVAGISLDRAALDLRAVQARLAREYPQTDSDLTITATPYRDTVVGSFRSSLWLLYGAVSILVLVACANIAALLLARAAHRERDIAIRASLGASRVSIAAHFLVETALLVIAGTAGGLLLAYGAVPAMQPYTRDLPTFGGFALDARVVAYAVASAVIIMLLCGLVPAIRSAKRTSSLSHAGRAEVSSRQRLNWALVGAQVTLSVTLLAGAGLLLRSFDSLARVDPGFESDHVLTFVVHSSFDEMNDPDGVLQRINRTIVALEAIPGVEAAATANTWPGVSFSSQDTYGSVDWTPPGDIPVVAEGRVVSPSYFEVLRIPLLRGELCRRPETPTGAREVMVNRAFAERYFGASPAVGHRLTGVSRTIAEAGESPSRIVGVVGNAREIGLHLGATPTVYSCYSAFTPVPPFLIRTTSDPMDVVPSIRARMAELEPSRPVYEFAPLSRRISGVYAQERFRTVLLTLFSVAALSLTCLGVYGTLSYIVSLRRREVGLRVALGAVQREIVAHYLARALKVVGVACGFGLVVSLLFARSLSRMLYGISPSDPLTFAAVIGIVLLVAVAAAVVPAIRASRLDPVTALRMD